MYDMWRYKLVLVIFETLVPKLFKWLKNNVIYDQMQVDFLIAKL